MAFERTFNHEEWFNGVNIVDADEFNVRFWQIEEDLQSIEDYLNEFLLEDREISLFPAFIAPSDEHFFWNTSKWHLLPWGAYMYHSAFGILPLSVPDRVYMREIIVQGETGGMFEEGGGVQFRLGRIYHDWSGPIGIWSDTGDFICEGFTTPEQTEHIFPILPDAAQVDNSSYHYILYAKARSESGAAESAYARIRNIRIRYGCGRE